MPSERNRRHRQLGKIIAKHEGSPTLSQSFINFGPQTAEKHVNLLPAVSFQFHLEERWGMDKCKLGVIYQERLKIEVKLLLSANRKSYIPRRLAQQEMALNNRFTHRALSLSFMFYFSDRVVSIWNSFSEHIVSAPSVSAFKNRLFQFQSVFYVVFMCNAWFFFFFSICLCFNDCMLHVLSALCFCQQCKCHSGPSVE